MYKGNDRKTSQSFVFWQNDGSPKKVVFFYSHFWVAYKLEIIIKNRLLSIDTPVSKKLSLPALKTEFR